MANRGSWTHAATRGHGVIRPQPAGRWPLGGWLLLAAGLLLGPGCTDVGPSYQEVALLPGEVAFTEVVVDAVGLDDELLGCSAVFDERAVQEFVPDLVAPASIYEFTRCAVQVKITARDDARPGRYLLRVEMRYNYYDHFFQENRSASEIEDIYVIILGPR